jgi:membrane protease YdiL (CAAX protease family)
MNEKMKNSRIGALLGAVMAAILFGALGVQNAAAVPVSVDPADAISQVVATAADCLPFLMAVIGAGLVFRYARKWLR